LNDYIDIGIFEKSERGNSLGKPIVYKRLKLNSKENTFKFKVTKQPSFVGIDPYNYLIDRLPKDNIKNVTIKAK
jgi:hypothetical protein